MSWLWPMVTGVSMFDVWTLPHLGFWVVVGSTLWALHFDKVYGFLACLISACLWELFERVAERAWPGVWRDTESFVNACTGDLLTCFVGFFGIWWLLDRRKRRGSNSLHSF